MTTEAPTIAETVTQIQDALREYIEATYHVGHPALIERRRALLEQEGVLFREPFIESTPRYQTGDGFADLGLDAPAQALLESLAAPAGDLERILYDPPYTHQAEALRVGRARRREPGHHHRHRLRQDGVVPAADAGQARQRGRPLAGLVHGPRRPGADPVPDERARQRPVGTPAAAARRPARHRPVPGVGRTARPVRPLHQPDPLPRGPQAQEGHQAPRRDRAVLHPAARRGGRRDVPGARPRTPSHPEPAVPRQVARQARPQGVVRAEEERTGRTGPASSSAPSPAPTIPSS